MAWIVVATAKWLAGVVAWLAIATSGAVTPPSLLPPAVHVIFLTVFVASGAVLALGSRRDPRAVTLGAVFAIFGGAFADRLIRLALYIPASSSEAFVVPLLVQPAAFLPLLMWRFAWDFPRPQPALVPPWVPRFASRLMLGVGLLLSAGMFVHYAAAAAAGVPFPARAADSSLRDYMWTVVGLLDIAPLALLVAKVRTALPEERRRVALFIGGLVLGTTPLVLDVLLSSFVPPFRDYFADPARGRVLALVNVTAIATVPLTTAYAVLVDRVFDTRFIIRSAIQYALAKYTLLAAMAIPFVAFVSHVYRARHEPLSQILSAAWSPGWGVPLLAAGALVAARRRILSALDRRFFREQHDTREILLRLSESSRRAVSVRDLADLIAAEVARALHAEAGLLVRAEHTFLDPRLRLPALDVSSALALLLGGAPAPLDVDTSRGDSAMARLPEPERGWLADAGPRLLVPLLDGRGELIGVLTVGEKRSELPYTAEDRLLLEAVAASAAVALERQTRAARDLAAAEPDSTERHERPARECWDCGRVHEPGAARCASCGGTLREAALPNLVAGKFKVRRRVGSGGMGIVYAATDTSLDRMVAIKTLPSLSASEGRRLRREARALATVQHEHLELIYGVESWRGAPVLVLEFFEQGTLADMIRVAPLPPAEVVRLGLALGEALHSLHRVGVLHRDIKPSNIGFTARHVPKLLDFGLAHAPPRRLHDPHSDADADQATTRTAFPADEPFEASDEPMAGTVMYMSPEAIAGEPPDVGFDLWGLGVTLYEALTGVHPFQGIDRADTIRRVQRAAPRPVAELCPDCPEPLARVLHRAIAARRAERPASARELVLAIRETAAQVPALAGPDRERIF